jgi:hypothetical protein
MFKLFVKQIPVISAVVLLVAVVIAATPGRAAAISASLYFAKGSATSGSDLYVEVRENSSTQQVNAVEADFTYPTSQLTYVGTDNTGTGFEITASETGGSGSVSIQLGTTTPKTNDQLVATVHFTVASSGISNLNFQNTSIMLNGGVEVLSQKSDAEFYGTEGPLSVIPVFRMYNRVNGDRLFTINTFERDSLQTPTTWRYEGVSFNALFNQVPGSIPVFRMYNRVNGDRLFTINTFERDSLQTPTTWRYEGVSFYAIQNPGSGTVPIFRMYNRVNGDRLFTINTFERDSLQTPTTWRYEGVSFYGL